MIMPSERKRKRVLHCSIFIACLGNINYYLPLKVGQQWPERESRTRAGLLRDDTRRFGDNISIGQFVSGISDINEMPFLN